MASKSASKTANCSSSAAAPEIVQVASGSTNPQRDRQLVDLVQSWFTENPLYDSEGQPIVVPASYRTPSKA